MRSRDNCPACGKLVWFRDDAAPRVHGPRNNRCPGKAAPLEGPPVNTSIEDEASHLRWTAMALALGWNILAREHAPDLGSKVYFRLGRDAAVKHLIELGGNDGRSPFSDIEDEIMTLGTPDVMPRVRFRASDIELMRLEVARHDLRATEKRSTGER